LLDVVAGSLGTLLTWVVTALVVRDPMTGRHAGEPPEVGAPRR
jgi:hypothetical protein